MVVAEEQALVTSKQKDCERGIFRESLFSVSQWILGSALGRALGSPWQPVLLPLAFQEGERIPHSGVTGP